MNWDSSRLATGGADFTVRLWDVETGTQTSLIDDKAGLTATAKSVNFSFCGNLIGEFANIFGFTRLRLYLKFFHLVLK